MADVGITLFAMFLGDIYVRTNYLFIAGGGLVQLLLLPNGRPTCGLDEPALHEHGCCSFHEYLRC